MINLNKIDEKDFVYINKRSSEKEEKEFSEFFKSRKEKKGVNDLIKQLKNFRKNSAAIRGISQNTLGYFLEVSLLCFVRNNQEYL